MNDKDYIALAIAKGGYLYFDSLRDITFTESALIDFAKELEARVLEEAKDRSTFQGVLKEMITERRGKL